MIAKPAIDQLVARVDSKYTLVVATAKRAREIMLGGEPLVDSDSIKPVSISLEELAAGKLLYERTKEGIK